MGNLINTLFVAASPHNCYGTSGGTAGCDQQWGNLPESKSKDINNLEYKSPIVIPQYQQTDKITPQIQQDSNIQMNQLLQPVVPIDGASIQQGLPSTNSKLDVLQNLKKGQ